MSIALMRSSVMKYTEPDFGLGVSEQMLVFALAFGSFKVHGARRNYERAAPGVGGGEFQGLATGVTVGQSIDE